jgi:hypothetical protein
LLTAPEEKTNQLATRHELFGRNMRIQQRQVLEAPRELTAEHQPVKRPIAFVTPEAKKTSKVRSVK